MAGAGVGQLAASPAWNRSHVLAFIVLSIAPCDPGAGKCPRGWITAPGASLCPPKDTQGCAGTASEAVWD